jgi:hypothetical protein
MRAAITWPKEPTHSITTLTRARVLCSRPYCFRVFNFRGNHLVLISGTEYPPHSVLLMQRARYTSRLSAL